MFSGGLPRLLTRVSLPTTLARGKQQCTLLVSPLLAAPTTPSATSPPSCPSDTSTLLATLLVSVLLSVLDTPTAKQKGAEKTLIPMGQILHLDQKIWGKQEDLLAHLAFSFSQNQPIPPGWFIKVLEVWHKRKLFNHCSALWSCGFTDFPPNSPLISGFHTFQ